MRITNHCHSVDQSDTTKGFYIFRYVDEGEHVPEAVAGNSPAPWFSLYLLHPSFFSSLLSISLLSFYFSLPLYHSISILNHMLQPPKNPIRKQHKHNYYSFKFLY
ncbi:hypothetical protein HanXRQr2_Chr14g0645231 [Helianthus annuus]|uniref:Uncharacterized protein n=1 Tax=Helianthus annuus TaxID=4232 RepID=A0A9K3EA97_HELAN|nr:hypothetical protein HanXRQr2_Chr14g0645231 [Helianthus annuus]KAJ0468727.1 hypothetical protein HanIR_Chr14g0699941 [Helianthus annuus]KAJ0840467.1 hypothetical protein HanPSC8_Chr14g0619111 [Helianthus annuus]